MVITLSEIACLVEGELHGDGATEITGADTLRDARPGEITFLEGAKLAGKLAASQATAVLVPSGFAPHEKPYVTVPDVHAAFAKVVGRFRTRSVGHPAGVAATAWISPSAQLGPGVTVYPHAVISENVRIGARSIIHSGVQILPGCSVGEDVVLFPNAVLYENTVVGARCLIHAGAVIGAYGFGYVTCNGRHQLSAQLGHVVLGDDVEIGACTTVDRGTYGATVIGDGTKIDNQVMIAHNCRIGRHNIICSQVGIAGSSSTGDYVVLAGQVGVRDHVHIGDRATVGAKGGVMNDVPAGATYLGIPAIPERQQMVMLAAQMKLPEMKKQLKALQRLVEQLTQTAPVTAAREAEGAWSGEAAEET
jgi:UDP-3-O-[3-hydroxymyristoyl] glucosamine N-acyltransferase